MKIRLVKFCLSALLAAVTSSYGGIVWWANFDAYAPGTAIQSGSGNDKFSSISDLVTMTVNQPGDNPERFWAFRTGQYAVLSSATGRLEMKPFLAQAALDTPIGPDKPVILSYDVKHAGRWMMHRPSFRTTAKRPPFEPWNFKTTIHHAGRISLVMNRGQTVLRLPVTDKKGDAVELPPGHAAAYVKPLTGRSTLLGIRPVKDPESPVTGFTIRFFAEPAGKSATAVDNFVLADDATVTLGGQDILALDFGTPVPESAEYERGFVDITEELEPYQSEWRHRDGTWQTAGNAPAGGWYLRSPEQYILKRLRFRVRKDSADGIVYLYTSNWRVTLREDNVMVRHMRLSPGRHRYRQWWKYWNNARRPVDFPAGEWQECELQLTGTALRLLWNGDEVLRWTSPHQEWQQRVMDSGKLDTADLEYPRQFRDAAESLGGKDEIVVLHAWRTGAAVEQVQLQGTSRGKAQGFYENIPQLAGAAPPRDWTLERLAPLSPVKVEWQLPDDEKAEAASLPAVSEWKLSRDEKVNPAKVWGRKNKNVAEIVSYYVGKSEDQKVPSMLLNHGRSYAWGDKGLPQELRIYLNLKREGTYTLKTDMGQRIGSGPIVYEVRVDGRPVSREVYRNLARRYQSCPVLDYVPLRLRQGAHRIDVRLNTELAEASGNYRMKYMRIPLTTLELVPGEMQPMFVREAGALPPIRDAAESFEDPPHYGEQYGKQVHYRVTQLQAGRSYNVQLGFYEANVTAPGLRLMDVFLNDRMVEDDLDVFKRANGRFNYVEFEYPVTARSFQNEGVIDIRLAGENFKAFVNFLSIRDEAGDIVYRENCGWTSSIRRRLSPNPYGPTLGKGGKPMPTRDPDSLFDGHNLIANPHFTLTGKKLVWSAAGNLKKDRTLAAYGLLQGKGTVRHDASIGRDKPGSLRVDAVGEDFAVTPGQIPTDYGKRQRFTAWVRTEGADGTLVPELVWFAQDEHGAAIRDGHNVRLLGRSAGQPVKAADADDWTQLAVEVKPPFGAHLVYPVVRVDGKTRGTVWIDDAEMNGYGAEPLEIMLSHIGYHPQSHKSIVFRSFEKAPVHWKLVNARDGRAIRSGEADYHSYEWFSERHYYTVDLSGVETEGRYRIDAVQRGKRASSRAFPVAADVYRELTRKTLFAIHAERYNDDVPGMHLPHGLESAQTLISVKLPRFETYETVYRNERRDMISGYDDASNEIKYTQFWPGVMLAVTNAYRLLDHPFQSWSENDAWDEMLWAFDSLHKHQDDDGRFWRGVKPRGRRLDNIPRYAFDNWAYGLSAIVQGGGACALAAYQLHEKRPELSRLNRRAALRNYQLRQTLNKKRGDLSLAQAMHIAAKDLFVEMFLAKLRDGDRHRAAAEKSLRTILRGLNAKAYRGSSELYRANFQHGGIKQDVVVMPCLFLELNPEHELGTEIRAALRLFARDVSAVSDLDPWMQARHLPAEDEQPSRYPAVSRPLGYWPALAYSLARIGVLLEDPDIIHLAERQLQWCLGKNFADVSVVHGTSDRVPYGGDGNHYRAEFMYRWLKNDRKLLTYEGMVPTLSFRDIGKGKAMPQGFFGLYLQANFQSDPAPSETYIPQVADFLNAAAAVHAAMEWLAERG